MVSRPAEERVQDAIGVADLSFQQPNQMRFTFGRRECKISADRGTAAVTRMKSIVRAPVK
jgi:hypothetical protein